MPGAEIVEFVQSFLEVVRGFSISIWPL